MQLQQILKRNGPSEMTNLLTKPLEMLGNRQGNQVVGDHDKSPVCLDALPRAHKDVAEGQVLFDVLVEDFDSKALPVKPDHLGFAHMKVVGNQESGFLDSSFGDKQKHGSNLGQMDDSFGDLELSLLGNTNGHVSPRSLGQVTDDGLFAVHFQNTVALDRGHESPACFDNRNKDRSAGIPAVHEHGYGGMNRATEILKDLLRQLNFAFEFALGARGFGPIASHGPAQPLTGDLQNTSHRTLALDQTIGGVVNAQAFDLFAFSGTGRIVDHDKQLRDLVGPVSQKILVGLLKPLLFLWRTIEETLQVVGKRLGNLRGDFSSGMKLDQPDQPHQVNLAMFDLGLAQDPQENLEDRRNFVRDKCSHGFCALLGCDSIGDFGRKPFSLKGLFPSIT